MSYKCENCRSKHDIGEDVYLIENAFSNILIPTCSDKCAKIIKDREIGYLKKKIKILEDSIIEKESW